MYLSFIMTSTNEKTTELDALKLEPNESDEQIINRINDINDQTLKELDALKLKSNESDDVDTIVKTILTNEQMYNKLITVYDDDLHKYMKTQFSDICSNGDIIINNHLNNMNQKNQITDFKLMDYIYDVYINEYLVGNPPDPWWAS